MSNSTNKKCSRRKFLAVTGGLIASPFVAKSIVSPTLAKAPMLGNSQSTHHRFKFGEFEITTILYGTNQVNGPHPIFGEDQSAGDVEKLMKENNLPTNKFLMGYTPVLVNTGNELVLFDTGVGVEKMVAGIESAGYSPNQIDIVVLTHFHPDHINGMANGKIPTFPNARYITGQVEYDFWSPEDKLSGPTAGMTKLTREKVVPFAEKMSFIGDEDTIVSGIVGMEAFGHTPGHMVYHIESNSKRMLIWGDVANHFVVSIQRPDWHVKFDSDKEMAAKTRVKFFDMLATEKIPFSGYHMPFPSLGFIEKFGNSYRWVQESYQLDL